MLSVILCMCKWFRMALINYNDSAKLLWDFFDKFGVLKISRNSSTAMGPKPRISLEDRGKVVVLSEEGYSQPLVLAAARKVSLRSRGSNR